MLVEASKQCHGQVTGKLSGGIAGHSKSMLSIVLDRITTSSPHVLSAMTTEDAFSEAKPEASLHEEEQLQAFNDIPVEEIQHKYFSERIELRQRKFLGVDDGMPHLDQDVEGRHNEEERLQQ